MKVHLEKGPRVADVKWIDLLPLQTYRLAPGSIQNSNSMFEAVFCIFVVTFKELQMIN